MLTLNKLIKILQTKQQNHSQLSKGTFIVNDPWEYGADNTIKYPLMGINTLPFSIDGKMEKMSFVMYFCDLQHKDTSNEWELKSDMHSIAIDVISQLRYELQNGYGVLFNDSITLKDFEERFDDEVTGWEVEISMEQFYNHSICDTPDSGANAGKVQIKDQSGNVIAVLNAGSEYYITVLSAIQDTIDANGGATIIENLT